VSVRSNILSNIEAVLKAVTGQVADSVFVGKLEQVDLDAADLVLPLTFAIQGPEQKASKQVMGMETWNWTITIEVWCSDTSVETLYGVIQAAMLTDITRGGYAQKTERTGGDVLPVDPGRGMAAFQQTYQIQYRHPWGTP
jgi:hypothetical protein